MSNHILQICPITHSMGFTVYIEPHIALIERKRNPDIIVVIGALGVVIDAQVAGKQADVERARHQEIRRQS